MQGSLETEDQSVLRIFLGVGDVSFADHLRAKPLIQAVGFGELGVAPDFDPRQSEGSGFLDHRLKKRLPDPASSDVLERVQANQLAPTSRDSNFSLDFDDLTNFAGERVKKVEAHASDDLAV